MKTVFKKTAFAAVALGAALAVSSPALAQFVQRPNAVQPGENVMLDTDLVPNDNTLRGTTNQTRSTVLFRSSTDILASPPQGQARIVASDDTLGALVFRLEDLGTFTEAEFNILASTTGTVFLEAFSGGTLNTAGMFSGGTTLFNQTFTISQNGQNFFGLSSATPISAVRITAGTAVISSIGQFRLGGIQGAVPEPATWAMMLFGFGAVGYSMRSRKVAYKTRQAV